MAKRAKAKGGVKRGSAKTARKTSSAPNKKVKARKKKATAKKTSARKTGGKTRAAKRAVPAASGRKKAAPTKNKSTTKKKSAAKKKSAVTSAPKTKKRLARAAAATKRGPAKKTSGRTKLSVSPPGPPAGSQDPIQSPQERPLPKTHLSDEELHEFRQLLLARRHELAGDVTNLSRGAKNTKAETGSDHSAMPIHMADLGTDNWEHEFTLGLIANEQNRIREIDDALVRIDDKTYGICLGTRKRISRARLRAKPWAKYCIDYARAREEGRAR